MNREQLIGEIFDSLSYMRKAFVFKSTSSRPHTPTHAQLSVLCTVSRAKMMTTKELANQFCMTSSAVTQLVDSLVDNKLISRKEDSTDRRRIRLELTKKGEKMLIKSRKQRLKVLGTIFAPLTLAELKQFKRLQQKLSQAQSNV